VTFAADVLQAQAALKKMHSTGWGHRQYMNFELRCIKNHGGTPDYINYVKRVFYAADSTLRDEPLQNELF